MTDLWEDRLQLALALAVGAAAVAFSWDNALHRAEHSGQYGWKAWVATACIETAAIQALLAVRRRRRLNRPIRWPAALLGGACTFQIAVQVEEAQRTVWGIAIAVLPTVTFLAMIKLALSRPVVQTEAQVAQEAAQETADLKQIDKALAFIRDNPWAKEPKPIQDGTGVGRSTAQRALKIAYPEGA